MSLPGARKERAGKSGGQVEGWREHSLSSDEEKKRDRDRAQAITKGRVRGNEEEESRKSTAHPVTRTRGRKKRDHRQSSDSDGEKGGGEGRKEKKGKQGTEGVNEESKRRGTEREKNEESKRRGVERGCNKPGGKRKKAKGSSWKTHSKRSTPEDDHSHAACLLQSLQEGLQHGDVMNVLSHAPLFAKPAVTTPHQQDKRIHTHEQQGKKEETQLSELAEHLGRKAAQQRD